MANRLRIGPFAGQQGQDDPGPGKKRRHGANNGQDKSQAAPAPLGGKGVLNLGRGESDGALH